MQLTAEEAMALIEIRAMLVSRGIEADTMSDEQVVVFANRAVEWLAPLIPPHEAPFEMMQRMAQRHGCHGNSIDRIGPDGVL